MKSTRFPGKIRRCDIGTSVCVTPVLQPQRHPNKLVTIEWCWKCWPSKTVVIFASKHRDPAKKGIKKMLTEPNLLTACGRDSFWGSRNILGYPLFCRYLNVPATEVSFWYFVGNFTYSDMNVDKRAYAQQLSNKERGSPSNGILRIRNV